MEARFAGQIIPEGNWENNNKHGTSDRLRSFEWWQNGKKTDRKWGGSMGKLLRYNHASRRANVGVGKDTVNIATNSGTLGEILSFVLVHSGSNHGP